MGKTSKLRVQEGESRYSYADGSRKLYDRDKMPAGLDEDIWHLVLFFEQEAERYGESIVARPIAYTELHHRIYSSNIININIYNYTWIDIVEIMMTEFWFSESNTDYSINTFCNMEKFDYYRNYVLASIERLHLITAGKRIVQEDKEKQPSKNTEEEAKLRKILTGKNEETDLLDKMRKFKIVRGEK